MQKGKVTARTILISGGLKRPDGFSLGDGRYYGAAKLIALDIETGDTRELLNVDEGNENYPADHPNLQFTSGCVVPGGLWLPTDTELRHYSYPELKHLRTVSHPFFQNIHSVTVIDGKLVCTSTGLDMVAILNLETGEPERLWNVQGEDPWHRFSSTTDYRQVHSTRPHNGHPNYVFDWQGRMWVTRCTQEDAVCIDDLSLRIDISGDKTIAVHDGHVVGDRIYFTSVDGCVCIADGHQREPVETVDLIDLEETRRAKGWCRGIMFDGDLIHVGFSSLRRTRDKAKVRWLKKLSKASPPIGAIVVTYDLTRRRKVREYALPDGSIDAIYGLLPEPPPASS